MIGDRRFSGAEQTEARFRRDYPWQKCEPSVKRAFCEWLGRRIKSIGKSEFSEYELGYRSMLNGQKTELELEKLQMSWDVFMEERSKAESFKSVYVALPTELPTISPQQHLLQLRQTWKNPRHQQYVRDRVAANPEWGIAIGADGPELAQ